MEPTFNFESFRDAVADHVQQHIPTRSVGLIYVFAPGSPADTSLTLGGRVIADVTLALRAAFDSVVVGGRLPFESAVVSLAHAIVERTFHAVAGLQEEVLADALLAEAGDLREQLRQKVNRALAA